MKYTNNKSGIIAPKNIEVLLELDDKDSFLYHDEGFKKLARDTEIIPNSSLSLKKIKENLYSVPTGELIVLNRYYKGRIGFSEEEKPISYEIKMIIPEGTKFWINEQLSTILSEKVYIPEVIERIERETDLSFLYESKCLDLLLINGRRVKWSPEIDPKYVKGIYVDDDLIIGMEIALKEVTFNPESETMMTKIEEEAYNDLTPMDDHSLNIINGIYSYIPTCGQLVKAFEKLTEINLTRLSLGLGVLYTNSHFATRTFYDHSTVWGVYHEDYKSCLGGLRSTKKHEILPFIKVI